MIQLFSNDTKIEVLPDNPIYELLAPFDGKFLGVAKVEVEEPEVVPPKPREMIYFDSDKYHEVLQSHFGNSTTYTLLSSVLHRFVPVVSFASRISVYEQPLLNYRLAEDYEGYKLLIPREYIISNENVDAYVEERTRIRREEQRLAEEDEYADA